MRLYQDAVRVEYWQGTYSVTVVTLVPWDTERVLRTLPCQVAARLSRRFSRSNLRILWRNGRLYSQMAPPILAGSGGFRRHRLVQLRLPTHWFVFTTARTNSHAVSLRDWIRLQFRRKKGFFPYASLSRCSTRFVSYVLFLYYSNFVCNIQLMFISLLVLKSKVYMAMERHCMN